MTINQQVNKNITKGEYFNNGGKGFNSPHIIEIEELNIKVEVYSHNLRASKVPKIESEIRETAINFKNAFGLEHGSSEQTFKIYVFDDKDDYTHLGGSDTFGFNLGDERGMCRPGSDNVCAEMHVYQKGGVLNLQHEFAHGLTYLAGGKQVFEVLPKALTEGIADYFEHYSDHKFNAQGLSIDKTEAASLDLSKILELKYSTDDEKDSLVYKTGDALVMYLQENHPNLLSNYLSAIRTSDKVRSEELVKEMKGKIQQFDDVFKAGLLKIIQTLQWRKSMPCKLQKGIL